VRASRTDGDSDGSFKIKHINKRLLRHAESLNRAILDRAEMKKEKRRLKQLQHGKAKAGASQRRVFVLDFVGDIGASRVVSLREEISLLLQVLRDGDEVLLRLESSGGTVHGYGLAASQLSRIRDRGVPLTVAIDKVAASGGYMMACVGQRVYAAPFAIVGSIGVVGQLPNFNRLLKNKDIDYEMHTAGEFKRTLTVFGENTDAARDKFRAELEETHQLFKGFIAENRPKLALDAVATGEHWYGSRALQLGLIDEIRTSDDLLLERVKDCDVYELHFRPRRGLAERLSEGLARLRGELRSGVIQAPAGML
jgi:serine protease SohB